MGGQQKVGGALPTNSMKGFLMHNSPSNKYKKRRKNYRATIR